MTASNEIESTTLDHNTIPPPSTTPTTTTLIHHHRHMRVCGICTSDWATCEFSNIPSHNMDIVHTISALEESILSGLHIVDGHKLSVREVRGVEREVEKLRDELQLLTKKKTSTSNNNTVVQHGEDEEEEEDFEEGDEEDDDDNDDDDDEVSSNDNVINKEKEEKDDDNDSINDNDGQLGHYTEEIDDIDDPFLIATKGKALVGEEYRQMLLANQWKSTSKNY
jgi:hypothetical protein